MKALVLHELHAPLRFESVPDPAQGDDIQIVKLQAASLNHRDLWITKGLYPGIILPTILGSCGCGMIGDRQVVINPNIDWGDEPKVQSAAFHILGLKTKGTFAEQIAIPTDRIHDAPVHFSAEESATLPLSGLTAYRATMVKAKIEKTDKVLISGIGGGVALFAAQFALATGAEVWATSSSISKLVMATKLGIVGTANYKDADWSKGLAAKAGLFDVIIDSAAGDGFNDLVKLAAPAARIVIYGGGAGKINQLNPQAIFWKQLNIMGSTMGNDEEFSEMLSFVNQHKIKPVIDEVFPLKEGNAALQKMQEASQFGKIVLRIEG
ncbi:MAG: zinc-binding dehydrogenase [Saprospiraceae bacterium]